MIEVHRLNYDIFYFNLICLRFLTKVKRRDAGFMGTGKRLIG